MIRLVSFPQNRFVAVEAVNLADMDWIFGCTKRRYTQNSYRYCKKGTSLTELSRWTGAAKDFGQRKLATVHLHSLIEAHPNWTHVLVKVSPAIEAITLNIDINDYASRQVIVNLPSVFSFKRTTVIQETEAKSLYYELILPGFNAVFQAYLLYVDPTPSCKATEYHVSAEVQVPWAENQEYYHYFTHQTRSPMKLRLYKTSPNVTRGHDPTEHVKVVLLLDPQCTFTISISASWYHLLAQSARNFSPVMAPYIAAAILLIARSILMHLKSQGTCLSIHEALRNDALKPYSPLLFVRVSITLLMAIPPLSFLLEDASCNNHEVLYFIRSIIVLPAYMTALGLINVSAAVILGLMVLSSQLAQRERTGLAERASGLQKVPMVVSATLICVAPFFCGAASLTAGAAFYAFMISKMYNNAKYASRFCRVFRSKNKMKKSSEISHVPKSNDDEYDANLDNINFHVMLFFLWVTVTIANLPALLTWARNFGYSIVLKPDTSYGPGLVLSICSACIWQMEGARKNLRYYDVVASIIFTVAVVIFTLGPLSITYVNYGVTSVFALITLQQLFDVKDIHEIDYHGQKEP